MYVLNLNLQPQKENLKENLSVEVIPEPEVNKNKIKYGLLMYVIVSYEGQKYPGQITAIKGTNYNINVFIPSSAKKCFGNGQINQIEFSIMMKMF